jgi:hypothetical protein
MQSLLSSRCFSNSEVAVWIIGTYLEAIEVRVSKCSSDPENQSVRQSAENSSDRLVESNFSSLVLWDAASATAEGLLHALASGVATEQEVSAIAGAVVRELLSSIFRIAVVSRSDEGQPATEAACQDKPLTRPHHNLSRKKVLLDASLALLQCMGTHIEVRSFVATTTERDLLASNGLTAAQCSVFLSAVAG